MRRPYGSPLEHVSKIAATTSVLLILALTLAIHPDITWLLRVLAVAGFVGGWLMGARAPAWLLVGAIAPALLRLLAGREGPLLDIVWMAGLAGGLLRVGQWTQWAMPFPWNVLIGGWALTLSLAWPVLVAREVGFRLAGFHDGGAINSGSLIAAPQAAMWILYVVLAQLIGAMWFEWARQPRAHLTRPIQLVHGLWIGTTVASLVAIVQGTIDLGFLSTEFWAATRRATGTMLDANSFGVCAALAAPVGYLGMRVLSPHAPAAAVAVFAVNFAGMWLSGSRTALLCGVVGASALVVGLWRERRSSTESTRGAVWVPAGMLVVLVVVLLTATASPIQRAMAIPLGRAGLAELWNRGGYGPIAVRMTRELPLTGVGAGAYRIIAPDYWRTMDNNALPLDNAQNWWRHQIAELGIFGGALIIGFSVLVGWRVMTGREGDPDVASASTVRGLLLGLGVTSFVGMPTQNPLVLYWLLALVAWFAWLVPDRPRRLSASLEASDAQARQQRFAWIVAAGLAIAYAAGHLLLANGSLHPAQRAQRANRDYVMGAYSPEPLPGSNEFRWTGQEAQFFWAVKSRFMAVRFWAHHPDVATRPVHVTLTSPCGVLFDEDLTSNTSMSVGMALPEGQRTLEATVRVSRTWSPADAGEADDRQLGVGIVADFSTDPSFATTQLRAVKLAGCEAGI
jgi:hypothetical protein